MNVQEMHIEVNQSTQKVAANRSRKLLAEEIDWILNKQETRFIQDKLRPKEDNSGFEIDQLGVDALRNIIKTKEVPARIESATRYSVPLPPAYAYLLSDSSYTTALCGEEPSLVGSVTSLLYVIKQFRDPATAAPYYGTMSFTFGAVTLNIPADLPLTHKYTGYTNKEDVMFLVPYVLAYFNERGINLYWERYDSTYFPNSYIMVAATATALPTMTIGATSFTGTHLSTVQLTTHTAPGAIHDNRLTRSDKISSLLSTAYFKPNVLSPISELVQQRLYIYTDRNFIVSNVRLSYIRKTQPISLALGTDCELAETFHQAICDRASEYIKKRLENEPGAALITADNNQRVIL